MAERVLTVSQLNEYVSNVLTRDPVLRRLSLGGEVSNWRETSSGHVYFALKDQAALIRCVMFRSQRIQLKFQPEDGMHVVAQGHAALYARDGQYQFYVQSLRLEGEGALYAQFERIKAKLAGQGYFDQEAKQPIPLLPRRVGVVTSPTGAVIHDIFRVTRRRFPNMDLLLCPVKVQGEGAAEEIARGIGMLSAVPDVDVIIVGRGGGSMEDLWAFNEEIVADAIYACPVPVISAVGHETDFTIADFVADLRAPTPSAAAELAVPLRDDCRDEVFALLGRCAGALQRKLTGERSRLALLRQSPAFLHPARKLENDRQRLDRLFEKAQGYMRGYLTKKRSELAVTLARLEGSSPAASLRRGFAIVQSGEGDLVSSASQLAKGQIVRLSFQDGGATARILTTDQKIIPGE